jgi:hypothetical protein
MKARNREIQSPYLTEGELADFARLSVRTIRRWRLAEPYLGPPFVKIGGSVRYHIGDFENWAAARRIGRVGTDLSGEAA